MLQILFAKEADERSQTFEKSLTMGFEYERRTKALILRSAMLKNQICVKVNSSTKSEPTSSVSHRVFMGNSSVFDASHGVLFCVMPCCVSFPVFLCAMCCN